MMSTKCKQRKRSSKTRQEDSYQDIDLSAIDSIVYDICCQSKKLKETDNNVNNDMDHRDELHTKIGLLQSGYTDPLDWSPYVDDILSFQKEREKEILLPINYLEKQEGITMTVREILVDWLIQVQTYMQIHDDALDLSIAMLDQYLARKTIELSSVQLLGIACLFVACKCEEVNQPTANDLCFLTNKTYTTAQLRQMEIDVLSTLNFTLCFPSAKLFLSRFLKISQQSKQEESLCRYLLDLSLIDVQQCAFTSSEKAASVVCLARKMLQVDDSNAWTAELQRVTGFSEAVLGCCQTWLTKLMAMQVAKTKKCKGVTNKYALLLKTTSSQLQTWIQTHHA